MKRKLHKMTKIFIWCIVLMISVFFMQYTVEAAQNPYPAKNSITVYVGNSSNIVMRNVKTSDKVTYTGSNNKIVKVSKDGCVTGIKLGDATIKIKVVRNGKTYQSTVNVTVKNPYLSIKHNSAARKVGDTFTFTVKNAGLSNIKVKWTSSDPSVVKIDPNTGEMKALKPGNAVITAKDTISGKKSIKKVEVTYTDKQLKKLGFVVEEYYYSGEYHVVLCEYTGKSKTVEIPYGIEEIEEEAFINSNITSVTIPETVSSIGSSAFYNCDKLEEIRIPDSVTEISMYAFEQCSNLKKVTLPNQLEIIEEGVFFECTSLEEISIPDTVKEIGDSAFNLCSNLKKVTLPSQLEIIDWGAFYDCTSLKEITIPDSVKEIGECAFYNCTSLTKVKLPKNLTIIKDWAFASTPALNEVIYEVSEQTSKMKVQDYIWHQSGISLYRLYEKGLYMFLSDSEVADYTLALACMEEMNILDSDPQIEKIRKVHDWMVYEISYSYKQFMKRYETERTMVDIVLKDRFAICSAYANTFSIFMEILGVPCIEVSSDEMNHAWNMVKLDDGHWYHVDVTWDDPGYDDEVWLKGWLNYQHLIRNDKGIGENHKGWNEDAPVADGTQYENYFDHSYIVRLN
ncbi:MAG: hypothetical protein E7256_14695 [Lachnospiraceae bacterium]|nr:hypothetical protein [Lachnospiraceae bacterium]